MREEQNGKERNLYAVYRYLIEGEYNIYKNYCKNYKGKNQFYDELINKFCLEITIFGHFNSTF